MQAIVNFFKNVENENDIILMVTHYGIITAMTGIFVDSGGAVAYNSKTNEYKKILFE